MIRQLDGHVMVSGQVAPHEVAGLAAQGIRMIVNNRPDGEDPGQPLASEVEAAAAAAGIGYRFIPIQRGIGPSDVESMVEAMDAAKGDSEGASLLAFCRSGTRSALTCALAWREQGRSAEEVSETLVRAGFDPAPISHLL